MAERTTVTGHGRVRAVRSLGVEAVGSMRIFDVEEPAPAEGQFWVDTLYSGVSAGTELTFLKGTNPYLQARWDEEWGIFRSDEPGQTFPIPRLGYMEVGRVAHDLPPGRDSTGATASNATSNGTGPGQLVAMAYGHITGHTADPSREAVVAVPQDIDPLLAIYLAQMGPICANGLLHAAAETVGGPVGSLGDGVRDRHVLVTGAGVVGLMTALFARFHGAAAVAVSDRTSSRLAAAEGLDIQPIDEARVEPWRYCKDSWRHGPADRGADVVFQCRGVGETLHQAMRSVRPQGTVIDLAFYQGGAGAVRLGEEFHHNGLTIRCAQIARVPRGLEAEWDRARLVAETVEVLRAWGPVIRRHLITDVVPFAEAADVIVELAERKRHAIQLVIDFNRSGAS